MTIILDLLNNDPRTKMRPDMPRHPEKANRPDTPIPVSYTHLTLPTIYSV